MNKTQFNNKLFKSTLNSSEWMIGIALKYSRRGVVYRCRQFFFFFFLFWSMQWLEWGIEAFTKIIATRACWCGRVVGRLLSYSPLGRIDALGRIDDIKNVTGRELPRTKGWGLTAVQKHTHNLMNRSSWLLEPSSSCSAGSEATFESIYKRWKIRRQEKRKEKKRKKTTSGKQRRVISVVY